MRTFLAFIVAVALPAAALAQNYSDAVRKQRQCASAGELAKEVYKHNTIGGKTLREHVKEVEAGRMTKRQLHELTPIFIFGRNDRFTSEQDAYMAVWADCMDSK